MASWQRSALILSGLVVVGILMAWQVLPSQTSQYETRIVVLKAKANLAAVFGNRTAVKRLLMQTAEQSQRELIPQLEAWKQQGEVRRYRRFWIINAIAVEGTPQVFRALERHPAVAAIRPNATVTLPKPIPSSRITIQQAFTWGLQKIRVPEAWQTFQVQGEGVVVGVIDTGIDPDHPDLRGKLRPQNGWFDAVNGQPTPYDDQGHGTHVSGTIAGGNASGVHIGVAPKATLIAAKAFDASGIAIFEWLIASMQWVMDPDGDPNTDDGADVVNNSWGGDSDSPTMIPEYRDIINAWIAARIFPAFAIGNEGPNPRTTSSPGDYPMAFGVGATDINDQIADFSSRGPVFWEGIGDIIKPDVSAPGVDIYSSVPGGGYDSWMGTSMACPHVAGTVALMLSLAIKNRRIDEIDVDFLKRALEETAVDLGAPGKDNDYGSGRIDTFEALRKIPPPRPIGFPNLANSTLEVSTSEATVGDMVTFTVRVVNSGNADAINVVVTVPSIPTILSPVTPQDGGVFDDVNRQVRWSLARVAVGQTVTLRFNAGAASEGVAGVVAQISAENAQTVVTSPASVRIVSPADPYEPNNSPTAASTLADTDITSERAYLAAGDQDWFKVNLPAGKVFWVEVRAWQIGSLLDAQLQVTDALGQTLSPNQLLFVASNYIGRDPVAFVKGNGSEVYFGITAETGAPPSRQRGSYVLRLREITTSASFQNFAVDSSTESIALKAGEVGIVLDSLKNEGSSLQQVLPFRFSEGLRLVQPSQARFFLPPGPRPTEPGVEPGIADWLLFIADSNEAVLSEVPRLPATPINIGRIWVQEREGVLFVRVEFVGRRLTNLAEINLLVDFDLDGDDTADARAKIDASEQALFVGAARRTFAFFNLSERTVEFGVRLSDLNNPERIQARAQMRDTVTGTDDFAPDLGWALMTRSTDGFGFGVSPASGTIIGGSTLTVSLIADARTAQLGDYLVSATIPSEESTLPSDLSHQLSVTVEAGPPARISLDLDATEVPTTIEQVNATVTVADAAGNAIEGVQVRLSVEPITIGRVAGTSVIEGITDENGQFKATITLTGLAGNLTVKAEAPEANLVATRTLTVRLGVPTILEVTTTPQADEQGIVKVTVDDNIVLKADLKDAKGNQIARPESPVQFQVAIVPVEGQPQILTVADGSPSDEDKSINGSIQVIIPSERFERKAGEAQVIVSVPEFPNIQPAQITVIVQPSIPARLMLLEQVDEWQASITSPMVKFKGEEVSLKVKVVDIYENPIAGQKVSLTIQQGLTVRTTTGETNENGEVTLTEQLISPGTHNLWVISGGLRLPTDWQQTYRIIVLPEPITVSSEKVRGLSIPFLPPLTPPGQDPPSLSELLGVDPQVLERRIVRYDPVFGRFEFVDPTKPFSEIGTGFFVKPRQTVTLRPSNGRLPPTDTVEVALQVGWNLIGFPIPIEVPWRLSTIQVRSGTTTKPLAQATDVVTPFMWRWDEFANAYKFVYDKSLAQGDFEGEIRPWEAYFIYAFQPCTLVVPVPLGARKENLPAKSPNLQIFSLKVNRKDGTDTLLLGLSLDGQVIDAALPPSPEAPTRTALIGANGTKTGVSVKPMRQKVVWTLSLVGSEEGEEVEISGWNLSLLGRNWSLTLVDPLTNLTCSLRTGTYRLRLSAGEERQLQIVAEKGTTQPLRVQNLRAIPMRGRGLTVEFSLTSAAQTEIVIQTLTGRVVRVLDNSFRHAGNHRVFWDGTVSSGQPMPAGVYLVKVIARDEKGRVAQSVVSTRLR
ncbi:conserved repeat domain-containing protein [Candidatus Fervidibacteria bacterium JGI MDM2 SSWTFF-3-K9]